MEHLTIENRMEITQSDYDILEQALREREKELQEIYGSVSWNITIPIRILGGFLRRFLGERHFLSRLGMLLRTAIIRIFGVVGNEDQSTRFINNWHERLITPAKKFARMAPNPVRSILRSSYYGLALLFFPSSSVTQAWLDFKRGSQIQLNSRQVLYETLNENAPESTTPLVEVFPEGQKGIDIFVFPIIDWSFRIQRPQHIAEGLGQNGYRVFYLSTIFSESDGPNFRVVETPCENVYLCQVSCPQPHPVIYSGVFTQEQISWVSQAIDDFVESLGNKPSIAIVQFPFWVKLFGNLGKLNVIYDCMDFHAGFSNIGSSLPENEHELLLIADAVTTSSQELSRHVERFRKNTIIRNAADFDFFSTQPEKVFPRPNKPVVGYIGAISEWFDTDLMCKAAIENPGWEFILVGSYAHADVTGLKKCRNVKLLGEADYGMLTHYLYAFDVCVIPFKLSSLIEHTNPVKLYEYLSAGKPVVSTNLPELALLDSSLVYLAKSEKDFLVKLREAMAQKDDVELAQERRKWASNQTWKLRVNDFDRVIGDCYPRVSVIVLCYNNLVFTKACLESLEKFTSYPDWELIVVDNASVDGTDQYLEDFAQSRSWVKVVINSQNVGFSAGNNTGIRASDGEYIVLLNNDTYVTEGWLNRLIRPLRLNPDLGLVGPVTNAIGNEAQIQVFYDDTNEMAKVAKRYSQEHDRQIFYCDNLAFFCVAFRRSLFDEIGELDEKFNIGFFEDDDYCMRVRRAGYRIGIAEDVFVHHRLSATLDTLGAIAKKKQFDRNLEIFEAKWGKWKPHSHRESSHAAV